MTFAQPFTDYEILDRVGQGAMGTVFKARQKRLSRIVALKVLKPSLARDTRYVDRLRREARIVAALNHPHIVTGYDLGEEGGYHFFVMEFVEGKSLRALLAEWGTFPEDQVLKVAVQTAMALDHAFQRGVIHRDVKPGNILIDEQGNVKLTDMGLAKGPADLTLTRDGATVGTPQYISPEQARNPQDADVRSDLWSLGATLYHMATGQPPFAGDTMAAVITNVLNQVPVPPRTINPLLSEGLSLVIRKLLAKNLTLRYQTPRELLDDLERVQKAQPPAVDVGRLLAGEVGPQPSVWRPIAATLAACALLGGAVWFGMSLRGDPAATPTADAFLEQLALDLGRTPQLRARWLLLQQAEAQAPTGSLAGIQAQRRRLEGELGQALAQALADLQGERWPQTLRWLEDPQRWPSLGDFEHELVAKVLLARTGFLVEQLPPSIATAGLVEVRALVAAALRVRDDGLQNRALHWLAVTLPARAAERATNGDFAAAERLWNDGLDGFFDGRQQPRLESVAADLQQALRPRFTAARDAALRDLAQREQAVATALRGEAQQGVDELRARLAAGAAPTLLVGDLRRLRDGLVQAYPGAGRFRSDPWPEVEQLLKACERSLAAAVADATHAHVDRALDLAWRSLCAGDATAAVALLTDVGGDDAELAARVEQHRQAIRAAGRVADAIVRALVQSPPVPGHPRAGGPVVELSVVSQAGGPQLLATGPGGVPRLARVSEFRFADLWRAAQEQNRKPFAELPADELELGRTVLAMIGDELGAGGAVSPFLRDEVFARIVRVRGEADASAVAFGEVLRRIEDALSRARQSGELRELDAALHAFDERAVQNASADDRARVHAATEWLQVQQQRQQRLADVRAGAPKGSVVEIAAGTGELTASVRVRGQSLGSDATDSWAWNAASERYECAGVAAPHADEMVRSRLDLQSGLPATASETECVLDLVLPTAAHGPRLWAFEFRGIGFLLAVQPDDAVRVVTIEGDLRKERELHDACLRALAGVLDGSTRARAVPGAVQRLRLRVDASPARTRGVARAWLDQVELCRDEDVVLDPRQLPKLTVYPLQVLHLLQVQFTARGL